MWWRKIWNSKIHERHKFLVWNLAHKGLSLKQNLVRRRIQINDTICMHRCNCVEDEVHMFSPVSLQKDFGSHHRGPYDGMKSSVMISMIISNIFGILTLYFSVAKEKHEDFILYSVLKLNICGGSEMKCVLKCLLRESFQKVREHWGFEPWSYCKEWMEPSTEGNHEN